MQMAKLKIWNFVYSLISLALFSVFRISVAEDGARLIVKPEDTVVELNTKINFFCRADGNPMPGITWKRNGKSISQARYVPETLLNGLSTLRIEPVKEKDNDSEITCTADNGRGPPMNASSKLFVLKSEDLPIGFPSVIEDPKLRAVEKGSSASMTCNVRGSPTPDVIWLKDLMPVDMTNPRYSIATLGNPGTLLIQQSEEIDEGKYECVARNAKGVAQSRSAHLYVKTRRVPPHFSIPPRRIYQVMPGGSVNMSCVAVGHPMPRVLWRRVQTNEYLEPPDTAPVGRNVLVLTNVQKTENFSCVAFSNLGNINSEVTVEVKALPDPPENLKVTNVSARSVALSWTTPSTTIDGIRQYVVRYRPKYSEGDGFLESEPLTSSVASISGLEPYTEYELSVLTVGEVGRGLPSRPVETTTFEAPPDKAPKNVQSRPLSTSTVLVQWEPPEKPNGQITGYKIYYSDKASDPYTIWPTKDVLEGKMAQISDLLPDMMYSIRVQARNSAGYSPLSDTVLVYTKAGIPGQPTNVKATAIGPSQVSVSWEPPLHPDVKNYVIRYNMSSNDHDNVEVPGTVNEYKIASLKPNTDYSFQVVAKSQRGEGAPSKFVTIRTSASVPSGFPEGVVVEALSSSAVRVIWDPPTKSSHNGLIRTYRISVAKKNAEDDEEDEEDGGASKSAAMLYEHSAEKQRSFVVENLLPYSTYKVSVAAGTSVGFGPDSPPVEVTTQSDVPGPPRNVHAELLNATTVKLNWSEPLEKNGPLSGYFVDIDELNEQNQFVSDRPMRTKSTKTEVVLYNLKPNTRFGARVSAYNRKGDGVPSKSKIFRTDKLRPSAPKNVQIEFLVDQSTSDSVKVRVKWEAPDNLLKTGPKSFLLKYKLKESSRFDREILVNDALQQDVDALKYGRTYEFRVWSMYEGEVSEKEGWNTMTTPVGIPEDAPVNVRYEFNNNNNNALLFTWDPPLLEFRNGEITRYETSLISSVEDPVTREVSQQEASFQGINPNAKYEFKVRAGTTKGLGPWSNITVVEHSLPEHWLIDVVELTALSDTEAGVRWNQIMDPKVQGYRVSYTNKPSMSHWTNEDILNQSVTTRLVTHLEPRATYQFCVKALLENKKMGECGLYKTLELKPRVVVKDLNVKLLDDMHTALLSWQYEGPRPMKFKVEYDFHKQYLTEQGKMHDPLRYTHPFTPVEETHLEITNLRNNSNYTFKVSVIYDGKTYWPINVTLKTEVGPPPWFHAPEVIDDKTVKNVVKLKINAAAEENGEIKLYWLVVAYSNYMNNVTETIRTEDLLAENDIYIAASFSQSELWGAGGPFTSKDQIFLVGDGRNSTDKFFAGGHHNRLLNSSRRYKAFVRAFVGDPSNKTNFKSSLWSKDFGLHTQPAAVIALSDSSFGIIGIVVSVIVVAVILGGIGIFVMNINKKKRLPTKHGSISKVALGPLGGPTETSKLLTAGGEYANMPPPINGNVKPYESVTADGVYGSYLDQIDMKRLNYPTPPMGSSTGVGPHPPIPIIEFAAHIERLKANDNLAFSQEYESIETGQQFTWDHSNKEFNKSKNRYANVIAYDHSRVILSTADNVPGSDYVNANYIDGYRKPKAYIATQGPLPETFADFWRMCWEENTSTIVMLTKLEERTRIKCDQYWPSRGQMTYGVVQVVAKETHEFAHYTLRSFDVFRIGCNDLREIKQLQFTAWPDHGVPDHPTPFLMFLKRVKTVNPSEAGPIVVHCSAGVGRTGAFIVIDTMMDRLRYENTVDIYGCVASIRSQRNYMVQTEDQYVFIHDAVLDAVHSGCTEVPVNKLYTHIQKLIQVNPMDNASNMELEFRILAGLKMLNVRFTAASLPCNKQKNRLVNILPFDSTRVYLSPLGADADGSDYINASFIDGYRKRKAYIATQGPLPNTVEDFWRMLWEMNSSIIVMLTKLKEMGREKCCQYWPEQQPERYGTLLVEPIAEYNMPQYVLREFRLTDTRDGQSRTIRHFHYIEWPEQGVPKAGEYFIEFIGQVHKTKEQFGQEGPITVHCSAGVGRTGVFIALSIILERMRYEGVVDVFTTVKLLRTQRPNMVQSEDQYHFCYRAALEYLGSFDHYALQTYE